MPSSLASRAAAALTDAGSFSGYERLAHDHNPFNNSPGRKTRNPNVVEPFSKWRAFMRDQRISSAIDRRLQNHLSIWVCKLRTPLKADLHLPRSLQRAAPHANLSL